MDVTVETLTRWAEDRERTEAALDAMHAALKKARKFTGGYSGPGVDKINAEIDAALAAIILSVAAVGRYMGWW